MNWRAFLANPPLKELELTEHAAPNVRAGAAIQPPEPRQGTQRNNTPNPPSPKREVEPDLELRRDESERDLDLWSRRTQ
jgi:hypothetical protein